MIKSQLISCKLNHPHSVCLELLKILAGRRIYYENIDHSVDKELFDNDFMKIDKNNKLSITFKGFWFISLMCQYHIQYTWYFGGIKFTHFKDIKNHIESIK